MESLSLGNLDSSRGLGYIRADRIPTSPSGSVLMISERLRKRISALNRGELKRLPSDPDGAGDAKVSASETTVHRPPERHRLEDVVEGVVAENPKGRFYLIDRSFKDLLHGKGDAFLGRSELSLSSGGTEVWCEVSGRTREDFLFVDVEATGLTAGTPLFLVGALFHCKGDLRVVQMFARDYTEEAPLLHHFSELLTRYSVVVSFNGKSYDLPYIRDRCVLHGIPFELRSTHLDLLHEARRLWRDQLPNCKLQTLERYVCRRVRTGDIPGAEIPDAYHRFVSSGNTDQIHDILHHNALDLITLSEILVFVSERKRRESSE